MPQGLMFDVQNPSQGATQTMAQAGQTMGAQDQAKTVTTKQETSVGDYIEAAAGLASAGLAIKAQVSNPLTAKAESVAAQVKKQVTEYKAMNISKKMKPMQDETFKRTYGVGVQSGPAKTINAFAQKWDTVSQGPRPAYANIFMNTMRGGQ